MRVATSNTGAMMPMDAYDGSSAMNSVAAAIRGMTKVSVYLRPFVSPSQPKTIAPRGEAQAERAEHRGKIVAGGGNITLAMTVARNA